MKRKTAFLLALVLMISMTGLGALAQEAPIVLRYVAWNVSTEDDTENMERRLIASYMEKNPNVVIEIVENVDFDDDYMASLRTLAASGNLPDIIMVSEVPVMMADGFLMDIREIATADAEWDLIPKAIEEATHFGTGIYTVPSALFSYGFFVNDDLFDAANIDPIQVGFEWEEMLSAVKALTDPANQVLGMNEVTYFPDWIPHYLNDALGHSTWDGEQFNLDSPEFVEGIAWCRDIVQGRYSFDALTEEQQAAYNAEWYGDVWAQGKMAITYDATYSLPDYEDTQEYINARFVGMPGNKNIVIPDFVGVSATCKYPEAAFDFIKYMTCGKEGFMERIALRNNEGLVMETLPLSKDEELLAAYFDGAFPGMEEAYATMDNTLVEGETVIPAYVQAMYSGLTGISLEQDGETIENAEVRDVINACIYGNLNIADYAAQLNRLANEAVQSAKQQIEAYLK